MPSKLCVWGNSLGVRLPRHVAEISGVQAGDYLYIRVSDSGEIVITPVKPRDMVQIRRDARKVKPKRELEEW